MVVACQPAPDGVHRTLGATGFANVISTYNPVACPVGSGGFEHGASSTVVKSSCLALFDRDAALSMHIGQHLEDDLRVHA